MIKTWIVSDTHFGHHNICKFMRKDGVTKLRPWDDPDEMDEVLVNNWNSVVRPEDRVYHLGDVVINRKALNTLYRLNGRKVLVKGNHDIFRLEDYLPHFDDIRAYVVKKDGQGNKVIMSHVPIHPESLGRFGTNIHGHLHADSVGDPRYICVCVENINYTPIEFSEALKLVHKP